MKIHFIGLGGIGVSALAKYYLAKGDEISGSDACQSEITDWFKEKGVKVFIGNSKENISICDLVIYSPAVKEDNIELIEAQARKIKCLTYPQALGELTKEYFTIAITGTHGKSTTTAMLSLILVEAGLDPTVIVGTKLKEFNDSNFRMGKSKYLVIEACEHEASFLNYWPQIIVITNIEEDHLDYYLNLENIKKAFDEFVSHLPQDGVLIKDFSLNEKEAEEIRKVMQFKGEHNVLNALAALKTARVLGIADEISLKALSKFKGAWRRMDECSCASFILIDDYAHHPTEIQASLKAIRGKYPDQKIYCVYQPHQYQRTKMLFNGFVNAFNKAIEEKWVDKLMFVQVYDVLGRETQDKEFDSKRLVLNIKGSKYIEKQELANEIQGTEVLVMMGAGSIYNFSQEILQDLAKQV